MKLLIHFHTSTVQPLKFGNGLSNFIAIRDVASERPGGAAPCRNLPAHFAHHTFLGKLQASDQFISYLELHCNSCLCTKQLNLNSTYENNGVSTLFSWMKRCVLLWTPPEDIVHLPEYFFWLHPCAMYWACDYLSMLGLKLIHISERGHWYHVQDESMVQPALEEHWFADIFTCIFLNENYSILESHFT